MKCLYLEYRLESEPAEQLLEIRKPDTCGRQTMDGLLNASRLRTGARSELVATPPDPVDALRDVCGLEVG